MDTVKQVIVCNMAVPMPIGRLMAQVAHASVSNLLSRGRWLHSPTNGSTFEIHTEDEPFILWCEEQFTKVVCKAWGKDAMLKIKAQAEEKGIYVSVMEEDGFITALAIGPSLVEDLEFTKGLALL